MLQKLLMASVNNAAGFVVGSHAGVVRRIVFVGRDFKIHETPLKTPAWKPAIFDVASVI